MDRDSFDVTVDVAGGGGPSLVIDASGSADAVERRLVDADGEPLPADRLEVTYRETDGDGRGVLAVANRLTGGFVLEVAVEGDCVGTLVDAALDRPDEEASRYALRLVADGEPVATYELDGLLVYDRSGTLDRDRSLLPGCVEL